jgi:hypothetical protein
LLIRFFSGRGLNITGGFKKENQNPVRNQTASEGGKGAHYGENNLKTP